jgi:peptide/nickel transport system substrate-binding protein
VKWQNKAPANGRALSVQDILFSLQRIQTDNPQFTFRVLLNGTRIEAVDSSHVKITTAQPDATFVSKLAADPIKIVAPEVVERAGKWADVDVVVGTGPFIAVRREQGVGAEYVRNPDYWKPGLPYLDAVRTKHFGTIGTATAYAAFLGGELDMVIVPGPESKAYIDKQGAGFAPLWYQDNNGWMTTPNTQVKPFDDPRVTKALRLLTDHEEFLTTWIANHFGGGRHGSFLSAALQSWDLTQEEYARLIYWQKPKDTAVREAMSLLTAAGFTRDNPLRFPITASTQEYAQGGAELLQSEFTRFSQGAVNPELKLIDQATYQRIRVSRDFAYGFFSNAGTFIDPDSWFGEVYVTGAPKNYWNFSDAELDRMITRQRSIFNISERKAAVKQVLTYMVDKWPGSAVAVRYQLNAVKPRVQNFWPEFYIHGAQYEQVWLDA